MLGSSRVARASLHCHRLVLISCGPQVVLTGKMGLEVQMVVGNRSSRHMGEYAQIKARSRTVRLRHVLQADLWMQRHLLCTTAGKWACRLQSQCRSALDTMIRLRPLRAPLPLVSLRLDLPSPIALSIGTAKAVACLPGSAHGDSKRRRKLRVQYPILRATREIQPVLPPGMVTSL